MNQDLDELVGLPKATGFTPMRVDRVWIVDLYREKLRESYGGASKAVKYSKNQRLNDLYFVHYLCFHENILEGEGAIKKFIYARAADGDGGEGISNLPYIEGELPFLPLLRWAKPSDAEISDRDVNDAHILFYAHCMNRDEKQFESYLARLGRRWMATMGRRLHEICGILPIKHE